MERITEALEHKILEKLCMDMVTTYYVELNSGSYRVIQMSSELDTAALNWEPYPKFSDFITEYVMRYLYEEDREEFLNWISAEHLKTELLKKERLTYHYRSKPNPDHHEYYEVQVIRISYDEEQFSVVLAFRHIDEIMEKEKRIQDRLKQALDEANLKNEVISAISKSYRSIYRIDLRKDFFEEISNDHETHKLTGYTGCASEKLYQICDNMIVPEYRDVVRPFLNLATLPERLKNDEYVTTEYPMCDGSWQRLRFIVKKRDEAGTVTHVLCTIRSASDYKRRELDLKFAAESAKREAELKTRFLASMSHDIRTPLNGVIGMINLANQYADDPEMLKKIREKSMDSLQYLVSLVNDILDMNKLQSGELKIQEVGFSLVDTLQRVNQDYMIKAAKKNIEYQVIWNKGNIQHPYLVGNPVYLERILANIADNAVKFSSEGSLITVWIEEKQLDEERQEFTFYCKDQGSGMSEEFLAQAFDMFSQEKESSRSNYEGSGLGLAIAKQLALRLGGDIELQSRLGEGTTAIIKLPFKVGTQKMNSHVPTVEQIPIEGIRALVVEDNELNREIAKTLLESNGLEVTCAADGQEAVELFEKSSPSYFGVIYMDIMMPRMNGMDAARAIRALNRQDARNIGIIAMSANAFAEDIIGSRLAGMNVHLAKPLDADKMIDALRQCLAGNEAIRLYDEL